MESYCTRCHGSTLTGAARNGAPRYHDFDKFLGVLVVADHIDEAAAAGPEAVNQKMPISDRIRRSMSTSVLASGSPARSSSGRLTPVRETVHAPYSLASTGTSQSRSPSKTSSRRSSLSHRGTRSERHHRQS
jgi:hypothetical protein